MMNRLEYFKCLFSCFAIVILTFVLSYLGITLSDVYEHNRLEREWKICNVKNIENNPECRYIKMSLDEFKKDR